MLESNRTKVALVGVGVGAAAMTAGALYLLRRRARRADTRGGMGADEIGEFADREAELGSDNDAVFAVDAELVEPVIYEAIIAAELGETWVEDLEVTSTELGPAPGRELPFADPSKLEPQHHGRGK
jgi:hypothetical protein